VCNFLAGLAPSFLLLFLFRALLGIGMGAEWPAGRRARDGDMAGAIARLHGRRDAGLVGDRVLVVECDLWAVLQLHRLAWPADDRHRACPADHLYPVIRQRTGDLGREPTSTKGAKPRSAG